MLTVLNKSIKNVKYNKNGANNCLLVVYIRTVTWKQI